MHIEDANRIFQSVRDACDSEAWDHRSYVAEEGDTPAITRKKYWQNLQVVRNRLRDPATAARTQYRLHFLRAAYDSRVVEEISARRQNGTIGCRLLVKTVIVNARTDAIDQKDTAHPTVQNLFTHSLLRSFSTRQIERELHVAVSCGDFISDQAADDARKKIYAPSVDTTFNYWCDLLTEHVVRGVWMHSALDLRDEWYRAWKNRLGMPTKILDMAYDFAAAQPANVINFCIRDGRGGGGWGKFDQLPVV